jgi:hypothetical protein
MKKAFLIAAGVLFAAQSFSKTLTVKSSGGDFNSVKAAVSASNTGDIVDIQGVFTESDIKITKSITLQGHGFANSVILGNKEKPTSETFSTMTQNPVLYIGSQNSLSNITVTIKDLTIKNGISAATGARAGGIVIYKISGLVTLSGLKIADNFGLSETKPLSPGGIYSQGANLEINHCWIDGNSSQSEKQTPNGGGILLSTDGGENGINSNVNIRNSTVSNNTCVKGQGGGIAICADEAGAAGKNINVLIENCTVYGNKSQSKGCGIWVKNRILNTEGAGFGSTNGAIKLTVNHCTVVNNSSLGSSNQSYGITADTQGKGKVLFSMNNSIVMGNYGNDGSKNSPSKTNKYQISDSTSVEIEKISNSIFTTGMNEGNNEFNNKLNVKYDNLTFESSLSSDVIPVLKFGANSVAKDFVLKNKITPLLTDQNESKRDNKPDVGAYEFGAK